MKKRKDLDDNKQQILNLYLNEYKSLEYIGKIFKTDTGTLTRYFKKWNINRRNRGNKFQRNPIFASKISKKYTCNDSYFSTPDVENSYWAGFIAADGNITKDMSIRIGLQSSDKNHLEKFKKSIHFSGNIKTYKYTNTTHKNKFYTRLEIFSHKLCDDIYKNFNITPRKTFSLKFPSLTKSEYILSFITGYIDGDGSIIKNKRGLYIIAIIGNLDFLFKMKEELNNLNIPSGNINRHKNMYCLSINKKQSILNLEREIIKLNLPRLNRKWDKLKNIEKEYYKLDKRKS